jgi:predicted enzyme related to lactoylglutathione lyase
VNPPADNPMHRRPHAYLRGELVVVIDCLDTGRAAAFWSAALGYVTEGPGTGPYRSLVPASGEGIEVLLQQVSDAKHGKNRVHLDLRTPDLQAEVARVIALGASQLTSEPIFEDGWRWHTLADTEGNEFCVLEPPG